MNSEKNSITCKAGTSLENFSVQLTNPMLYDRLHTLSAEYSISVELLVNTTVKQLISSADSMQGLRIGKIEDE